MQRNEEKYDVIVVGGGASGMIAANTSACQGVRVLLIEKNAKLGEKLRITGGGRCNITNAEEDVRTLLSNYGISGKYLFSAFHKFGMQDTIDYFESIGLPIKIEQCKRAFPVSESAADVVTALEKELRRNKVEVRTNSAVSSIYAPGGHIEYVQVGKERLRASSYILATGGTSRPETGSTGDGFKWLASTGHTVSAPTPNITPLKVAEKWVSKISGTKAQNVSVRFCVDGKSQFKVVGDVLFTHFGLSGPTILNSSNKVAELLEWGVVTAEIDCFPNIDQKILDKKVISILQEHDTKQLKNTLRYIAPGGLSKAIEVFMSSGELETKISELPKEVRFKIVKILKKITLTIESLMGFEKAVVADGGVSLNDIDTRTFKSKKVDNLYTTGDLLDINRPSGGYSLQLCWTTGYIAGLHSAKRNE